MFIVVSYDIVEDKTRNKISKALLDFGTRVQYSVFECNLNQQQLEEMEGRLLRLLDSENDTIRLYLLCENCVGKVRVHGRGMLTRDEEVYVV